MTTRAQSILWRAAAYTLIACLAAFAVSVYAQERTATITFSRPTQYVDGTPISPDTEITYRLYQGARGAEKQRVAEFTGTSTSVNSGLKPGETCWQVSAVANGIESERSNEGCKTFPWPATEAVTITIT